MKSKRAIKSLLRALYGDMCLKCKWLMTRTQCKIDHVMPKSKGGGNALLNLQPLCYRCNSEKADTYVDYRPVELVQLLSTFMNVRGYPTVENCRNLRTEYVMANQDALKIWYEKLDERANEATAKRTANRG